MIILGGVDEDAFRGDFKGILKDHIPLRHVMRPSLCLHGDFKGILKGKFSQNLNTTIVVIILR